MLGNVFTLGLFHSLINVISSSVNQGKQKLPITRYKTTFTVAVSVIRPPSRRLRKVILNSVSNTFCVVCICTLTLYIYSQPKLFTIKDFCLEMWRAIK